MLKRQSSLCGLGIFPGAEPEKEYLGQVCQGKQMVNDF